MTSLSIVTVVIYSLICATAALQDAKSLKISNLWPVLLVVLGLAAIAFSSESGVWWNLLSFAIVFAAGALLFGMGLFGGGDAKFAAAAALAFPPSELAYFLMITLGTGGVVALISIIRPGTMTERRKRRIPYGVPIAVGAISSALMLGIY